VLVPDARVTDSMMPEGVEHSTTSATDSWMGPVTDSMMPEGVEHDSEPITRTPQRM